MDLQARIERRVSLDIVRHADYHRRSHLHEHAPSRPGTPSPRLHRARTSIICSLLLYITEGEVISMYWPATETPAPYSPGTRKGSGPNLQRAESHQYGQGFRHNRNGYAKESGRYDPQSTSRGRVPKQRTTSAAASPYLQVSSGTSSKLLPYTVIAVPPSKGALDRLTDRIETPGR